MIKKRPRLLLLLEFIVNDSFSLYKENIKTESSEFIFELQNEHVHSNSIVELPNGDYLVVWFQGSGERKSDDVKLMDSRLVKGLNKWAPPFLMADTPGMLDCNPMLFLSGEGKLFMFWVVVLANRWETSIIKYKTSVNYAGRKVPVWNWQDNVLLKPGNEFYDEVKIKIRQLTDRYVTWAANAPKYDNMIIEASADSIKRSSGWMTRCHALALSSGRIVLSLYSDGYNFSLLAYSDDNGASWKSSFPIVGRGNIQPSIVEKNNGYLVAFMRDNGDLPGRDETRISIDGGLFWSPSKPINVFNTGSSVEVSQLVDGRWLMVNNDLEDGRFKLLIYLFSGEGNS